MSNQILFLNAIYYELSAYLLLKKSFFHSSIFYYSHYLQGNGID